MKSRSTARVTALQVLYEVDCSTHDVWQAFADRVHAERLSKDVTDFARDVVTGTTALQAMADKAIQHFAPEYPVDQMAVVDRNILRMAIWEITQHQETPVKVVINEAVELAKTFGSDTAPSFINGVLGAMLQNEAEFTAFLNQAESSPTVIE